MPQTLIILLEFLSSVMFHFLVVLHNRILIEYPCDALYRVRKRNLMKPGEQIHIKAVLEAHHMKTAVTMKSLVLVAEALLMSEEVQDPIKKIGSMVILGGVLLVLRL